MNPNNSTEEVKEMIGGYIQPFANPKLNSLLEQNMSARGKFAWQLEFNTQKLSGYTKFLHLVDNSHLILDYSLIFFAIDIANKKVLGFQDKSENSFIVIGNERQFYFFAGHMLFYSDFHSFHNKLSPHHFVPGLGLYTELEALIPSSDVFMAGIQNMGNPRYPQESFLLYKKKYTELDEIWNLKFEGMVVKPPVSAELKFVLAQDNIITIVDKEGTIINKIKDEFSPVSCSIGNDNLIYMVCKTKSDYTIRSLDFEGNIIWEHPISITQPNQPPIISENSMVFIIGCSKIEAMKNGKKLWEFPLASRDELSQLASVTKDGMLLVSDGNRVICLNESGNAVWIYQDDEDDVFVTQPVLDSTSKVFVATNKKVVVLK